MAPPSQETTSGIVASQLANRSFVQHEIAVPEPSLAGVRLARYYYYAAGIAAAAARRRVGPSLNERIGTPGPSDTILTIATRISQHIVRKSGRYLDTSHFSASRRSVGLNCWHDDAQAELHNLLRGNRFLWLQPSHTTPPVLLANWQRIANSRLSNELYGRLQSLASLSNGWYGEASYSMTRESLTDFFRLWWSLRDVATEPELALTYSGHLQCEWYLDKTHYLFVELLGNGYAQFSFADEGSLIRGRDTLLGIVGYLLHRARQAIRWRHTDGDPTYASE